MARVIFWYILSLSFMFLVVTGPRHCVFSIEERERRFKLRSSRMMLHQGKHQLTKEAFFERKERRERTKKKKKEGKPKKEGKKEKRRKGREEKKEVGWEEWVMFISKWINYPVVSLKHSNCPNIKYILCNGLQQMTDLTLMMADTFPYGPLPLPVTFATSCDLACPTGDVELYRCLQQNKGNLDMQSAAGAQPEQMMFNLKTFLGPQ